MDETEKILLELTHGVCRKRCHKWSPNVITEQYPWAIIVDGKEGSEWEEELFETEMMLSEEFWHYKWEKGMNSHLRILLPLNPWQSETDHRKDVLLYLPLPHAPTVKGTLSMPNYASGFSSLSNLIKGEMNISKWYFLSNIQPDLYLLMRMVTLDRLLYSSIISSSLHITADHFTAWPLL